MPKVADQLSVTAKIELYMRALRRMRQVSVENVRSWYPPVKNFLSFILTTPCSYPAIDSLTQLVDKIHDPQPSRKFRQMRRPRVPSRTSHKPGNEPPHPKK